MKKILALTIVFVTLLSCQNGANNQVIPKPSEIPSGSNQTISVTPSPIISYTQTPVSTSTPSPTPYFPYDIPKPCPPDNALDEYRDKVFTTKSSLPCVKSYGRKPVDLLISPNGNVLNIWQSFPSTVSRSVVLGPVYLTKYDNKGTDVLTQKLSNDSASFPDGTLNNNNEAIVSWFESGKLMVQKFDSNLTPSKQKLEFTMSSEYDISFNSSLSLNNNGDFFVSYAAYTSKLPKPELKNEDERINNTLIQGKFYNSTGTLIKEIQFWNADIAYVTSGENNSFIIAYREFKKESNNIINVQRYNNLGEPEGFLIKIDTGIKADFYFFLKQLYVTSLKNGSLIVGWRDESNFDNYVLKFRIFNRDNSLRKSFEIASKNYDYSETPTYSINSYKNGDFAILFTYVKNTFDNTDKFDTLNYYSFDINGEAKSAKIMINDKSEKQSEVSYTSIDRVSSFIDENDILSVSWPENDAVYYSAQQTESMYIYDYKMKMKKYDSSLKQIYSGTLYDLPL